MLPFYLTPFESIFRSNYKPEYAKNIALYSCQYKFHKMQLKNIFQLKVYGWF